MFDVLNPSIGFLELYALMVAVVTWDHKDHTHSVYDRVWQMFSNFIDVYSKHFQSLHDIDSGVRHKLKLMGKDDFQNSFLLKLVLCGTKKSTQQPDV